MTALFERAVGTTWEDLHPRIRDRYGLVADEGREAWGRGVMRRLHSSLLAFPVLWLGTNEDFLFPERETDVPFTVRTEAFVDDAGREALFIARHFETNPPRDFVDTLRWNPARGCITDLFGRNGHVAADLHLRVADGALALELGTQWLRARDRYVTLPGPLSVDAALRDSYDDGAEEFRVSAEIRSPLVGQVFSYRGWFEHEFRDARRPTESTLGGVDLPDESA